MKILLFLLLLFTITIQELNDRQQLEQYFYEILDNDKDGQISKQDFFDLIQKTQYEEGLKLEELKTVFDYYDHDKNGFISIHEFLSLFPELKPFQGLLFHFPKQIHISLTNDTSVMQVIWVTPKAKLTSPEVKWGESEFKLDQKNEGSFHTYNVGHLGFHGNIYVAYMTNLKPRTKYHYLVGDKKTLQYSEPRAFISAPEKKVQSDILKIAMFGDFGTIIPFSLPVSKMIQQNNLRQPYNLSILLGDIAYAGVSHQSIGELEPVWNVFGDQIEPWASRVPFLAGVGNHESYYNYTSYINRYQLPQSEGSEGNFWWSIDYANIHFVHMSTEHNYEIGSPQWNFLKNDLEKASNDKNIDWIFFGSHRPFYNSDANEYDQHQPGCHLLQNLEDLFYQYVDVVFSGHMHCHERTYPIYKGKVVGNETGNVFTNPQAPIYVTQGTAGAAMREKWIDPQPEWSLVRYAKYGYGNLIIYPNKTLHYQSIDWPNKHGDEFFIHK